MRLTDPSYAVDLVIGNPPYSLAEQFVCHSLTLVKPNGYVIFLLRLSFLCSSKRINGLYQKHPLRAFAPIAPRPSFTEGGNDNSEYAAFVWQQGFTGVGRIEPPIIWRKS